MGSRKRAKPNPPSTTDPVDNTTSPNVSPDLPSSLSNPALLNPDHPAAVAGASSPSTSQEPSKHEGTQAAQPSTRSWYGGSWPRMPKSTPVTQVLRESISGTSSTNTHATSGSYSSTPEIPSMPTGIKGSPKSPSLALSLNSQKSSRSLPAVATTTKVNITSGGMVDHPVPQIRDASSSQKHTKPGEPTNDLGPSGAEIQEAKLSPELLDHSAPSTSSWLGWFSRPTASTVEVQKPESTQGDVLNTEIRIQMAEHGTPEEPTTSIGDSIQQLAEAASNSVVSPAPPSGRTWFTSWTGSTAGAKEAETPGRDDITGRPDSTTEQSTKNRPQTAEQERTQAPTDVAIAEALLEHPARTTPMPDGPSGWAFWSREKPKPKASAASEGSSIGEMAVANNLSQSHPVTARCKESETLMDLDVPKSGNRARPKSLEASDDSAANSIQLNSSSQPVSTSSSILSKARLAEPVAVEKSQRSLPLNLLLPLFRTTYRGVETPSILQQITRLLLQGRSPGPKPIHIVREPPLIRKAIAIGIHGYFPAPLIRTVLGQPTGTSVRFANATAAAIRKWTGSRGYECEIEKVALEGEGKIGERVDTLWKLLLNWIDHIQKADFILVACHSQGVPVAVMLVAKLVEFGCVNSARIGVCAMAGVNLGPFPDYKSRLFNGSAGELFEFSNPDSVVSKRYEDALRVVVQHGVRLLLVGSIDDQLVSLESSTFSTISHPYIYRAVFVDGRVHAPDFITHLVGFALKLRNLGISDHGLIRELSSPLAGSLYSGEGHSRIYDDEIVYDLAVEHALETSSVGDVTLEVRRYDGPTTNNPYILPWAMRGLLEEEYVRTELYDETTELLRQFDNWKPTSKVLKDVKFRLEAVKSKL